jgi:hypothetical protein
VEKQNLMREVMFKIIKMQFKTILKMPKIMEEFKIKVQSDPMEHLIVKVMEEDQF